MPTQIIPKGPRERYVIDGWKLHNTLALESGFTWVIDIIGHFSKYMISYPIISNEVINALNCIREFCLLIGFPTIL